MKKSLVSVFSLFLFAYGYAQNNQQYIRPSSIGFSFVFYDFVTPQRIKNSSLATVVREKQTATFKEMGAGIAFSYFKGLHNKLDLAGTLTLASADYTIANSYNQVETDLLLQADVAAQFKMLPDKYFFSPYVTAGLGANKYDGYFGAFMPVGLGFKINVFEEAAIFVNAKYHVPVTDETIPGHFVYGFGIAGIVGKKRTADVKAVPVP
jgi:hypothetical protein